MPAPLSASQIEPTLIEYWQIEPIMISAAESGVHIDRFLQQVGLLGGLAGTKPDEKLRLSDYFRLQRDIARALDDLTLQLSERKLTYQTGDFVLSQMRKAENLRDAIGSLAEYFNMMHGDAYNSVRLSADHLTLVVDDSTFPYTFRDDDRLTHFVGDCVLIKVHCLLDSLSNGLAGQALRRIGLLRSRAEPGRMQNLFWTVPIKYERAAYELVYDFETTCQAIKTPGSIDLSTVGIFARVIDHLEARAPSAHSRSFKSQTLDLVARGLNQQSDVASALNISVATLRRRLSEEASSFRDLVQEVKFEQAERLLAKGRSTAQVSEQLDYSDVRAFNRAFKKWKGETPAAYAKAHSR